MPVCQPLGLQRFDEGRQAVVHGRGQCGDPVDVVPCAGEDGGAAGRTDRVGAEAVVEAHATLRDAVEIGRPVDAAAIATHGVRCVVVGHDEEDVGLAGHTCFLCCCNQAGSVARSGDLSLQRPIQPPSTVRISPVT